MKKVAVFIVVLFLINSCQTFQEPIKHRVFVDKLDSGNLILQSDSIELTQDDGLARVDEFKANASVFRLKGIQIDSTMEEIIKAWGNPSSIESFPELDVINIKYNSREINQTVVIFHVVNNSVRRVVLKEGANSFLVGKSKINYTKNDIITTFGKPDKEEITKFATIYYYYPEGLEIYHKRKHMIGWGFVAPQEIPVIIYNVTTQLPSLAVQKKSNVSD